VTVRIALIGAGVMGADHARIFAQDIPNAELRLVCDASPERAERIAQACGVRDVLTDPLTAIARSDIDAVVIASPDETHAPLSIAAIRAGKSVLCEKPLSPGVAECLQVIDEEVKLGRRMIQLGFMRRFDPSYAEMKALLGANEIGRAVIFHCQHRNVTAPANFTGQMAISNSAPHEFDIARFVLDSEVVGISAYQPKLLDATKTGTPVFMVLETQAGQLVNVEINNNAAYGYDVRGELVGELGSISLNSPVHSHLSKALRSSQTYPADWRPRFAEAYRLQDKAWIHAITSGTPSSTAASAWDGYCATLIAASGVRALETGTRVAINMVKKASVY
jgi:myo-inositol 2-dehydrogenase / D-chiro-inositol 1-dehydrogenase